MADVHEMHERRREFLTDGDRSALRATWHDDNGIVVLSLWRGDVCVATSHLTPKEAGRLATFITGGLADLAHDGLSESTPLVTQLPGRASLSIRIRRVLAAWRHSAGRSLESLAKRLQ